MTDALAIISGGAAAVAGVGYLLRRARRAAAVLDAIEELVGALPAIQALIEREMEHNHGSSMKDDVHGMAVAIGKLSRRVEDWETAYRRDHIRRTS